MSGTICALIWVGVTHAYMDGVYGVLVKRCTYKCGEQYERHQIYYEHQCPNKFVMGGKTTSLYDIMRQQRRR